MQTEEYESGKSNTGGERRDGEGGEEVGEEEGGARVDHICVLNADLKSIRAAAQVVSAVSRPYTDLKSMRAAAQVVIAVMGREERR